MGKGTFETQIWSPDAELYIMSLDCRMQHKALQIAEASWVKEQNKHSLKINTKIQYQYIKIKDSFACKTCYA